MTPRGRVLGGIVAAAALSACTLPPHIYVFNNSGQVLRLHTDRVIGNDRWDERVIVVAPGKGRSLHFAKLLLYPGSYMRVAVGSCEIAYEIPHTDWDNNFRYATFGVRVEPDLTMRQILPEPAEGEDPKAAAHPDFPLKPVSRVCP